MSVEFRLFVCCLDEKYSIKLCLDSRTGECVCVCCGERGRGVGRETSGWNGNISYTGMPRHSDESCSIVA